MMMEINGVCMFVVFAPHHAHVDASIGSNDRQQIKLQAARHFSEALRASASYPWEMQSSTAARASGATRCWLPPSFIVSAGAQHLLGSTHHVVINRYECKMIKKEVVKKTVHEGRRAKGEGAEGA